MNVLTWLTPIRSDRGPNILAHLLGVRRERAYSAQQSRQGWQLATAQRRTTTGSASPSPTFLVGVNQASMNEVSMHSTSTMPDTMPPSESVQVYTGFCGSFRLGFSAPNQHDSRRIRSGLHLAKVDVEGSNPFSRSTFQPVSCSVHTTSTMPTTMPGWS